MFDIRTALRLDALASGALGLLLAALAGVLDGPLGLPVALSVVVGLGLLAWAAFVAWVAATARPGLVREVIVLNVVWVLASVVYAIAARDQLTGLGTAFVVVQAAAVAGLTELQVLATRRTAAEPVPA